jgi:hypothetical protein
MDSDTRRWLGGKRIDHPVSTDVIACQDHTAKIMIGRIADQHAQHCLAEPEP